jgi:hypothetical protein
METRVLPIAAGQKQRHVLAVNAREQSVDENRLK